jgi:hypothetical protein
MGWSGHVAHLGQKGNGDRVFEGKHKENIPLGIPTHIREDNFKTDLKEIG